PLAHAHAGRPRLEAACRCAVELGGRERALGLLARPAGRRGEPPTQNERGARERALGLLARPAAERDERPTEHGEEEEARESRPRGRSGLWHCPAPVGCCGE